MGSLQLFQSTALLTYLNPSAGKKNWEFLLTFYVKWKSLLVDRLKGNNIYYQTYVGC